jgi:hypothetical protein
LTTSSSSNEKQIVPDFSKYELATGASEQRSTVKTLVTETYRLCVARERGMEVEMTKIEILILILLQIEKPMEMTFITIERIIIVK